MIAVFDLDGTICDNDHRKHLAETKQWDAFNAACVDDVPRIAEYLLARAWRDAGHTVLYCTGRDRARFADTENWLTMNGLPCGEILMRAPGDRRDDAVVKLELVLAHCNLSDIAFVVEDRDRVVAMWRAQGVTCFQCQPGAF